MVVPEGPLIPSRLAPSAGRYTESELTNHRNVLEYFELAVNRHDLDAALRYQGEWYTQHDPGVQAGIAAREFRSRAFDGKQPAARFRARRSPFGLAEQPPRLQFVLIGEVSAIGFEFRRGTRVGSENPYFYSSGPGHLTRMGPDGGSSRRFSRSCRSPYISSTRPYSSASVSP